jgi:hypothetical protein
MTKLTKAQLVAEIEALRAQLNTQHEINRRLIGDMATARALIANAQPSPNLITPTPVPQATKYAMPEWQQARGLAMAAAKAKAMQHGTVVIA